MTSPLLLFWHGWAGTPAIWDPVCQRLRTHGMADADMICLDEGYYGTGMINIPDTERKIIGVGHSLGVARLLLDIPHLAGLVALNGFTRFTQQDDFPQGTPPRLLAQMRRRLLVDPVQVLADFHNRAGMPLPPGAPDVPALANGLDRLAGIDARAALAAFRGPVTASAAQDDEIVPPAQALASFPTVRMLDWGAHALPMRAPDLCATLILDLAASC